jgi:hypothetical protein
MYFFKINFKNCIVRFRGEDQAHFCFSAILGLELRAFSLSHSTSPIFVKGFSGKGL